MQYDLYMIQEVLFQGGIAPLLTYIGCIALGIFTLLKNPKNKLNLSFTALSFTAAIWNIIIYFIIKTVSETEAIVLWRLYVVTTILLLTILIYFCATLTKRNILFGNMILTALIITPLILFTDMFVNNMQNIGNILFYSKGPMFFLTDIYKLLLNTIAIYFLYTGYKTVEENTKNRIKLVSIGLGISMVVGIFDILVRMNGIVLLPFSSITTLLTIFTIAQSFKVGEDQ